MAEVEIAIGKSKYHLQCQEGYEAKLLETTAILNERVNNLALSFRNLDEKTLLVILALTMESELQEQGNKPKEEDKIKESDVYNAVSESMENITTYIEKLTKKIHKY